MISLQQARSLHLAAQGYLFETWAHEACFAPLSDLAHRALGMFEVKALFMETSVHLDDESVQEVSQAIHRCAAWHATPKVEVVRTAPVALRARLRKALSVVT